MFAIRPTPCSAHEHFRPFRRNRERRDSNCRRCDQDRVAKDADRKKRITSNRDRETYRPHQPQYLQNIVADAHVRNMAQRAYIMIKHEIPCVNGERLYVVNQSTDPFADRHLLSEECAVSLRKKKDSAEPLRFQPVGSGHRTKGAMVPERSIAGQPSFDTRRFSRTLLGMAASLCWCRSCAITSDLCCTCLVFCKFPAPSKDDEMSFSNVMSAKTKCTDHGHAA